VDEDDIGWLMIRIGMRVGECFFLVLAHPGSPNHPGSPQQTAVKWLSLLLLLLLLLFDSSKSDAYSRCLKQ